MLRQTPASVGQSVLFVVSPRYATPANDFAGQGLERVSIAELTPEIVAGAAAVIFNIDLVDAAERDAVRTAMARLPARPPLIFAVDRGVPFHFQSTQANALGARSVVKRPFDRRALQQALEALAVRRPLVASFDLRVGGRSVAVAEQMIGASFAALSTGAPLQMDMAVAASQELFTGVGQAGLHAWLDLVRDHHAGTFQHCLLVTGAAVAYAAYADLMPAQRTTLAVAALLHDIGKAEIPNAILDKPGKLTEAEFAVVKRHSRIGADYLTHQGTVPSEVIEPILHHHEYLDGSGYPDALQGDRIGPLARILTVCDIYGAMIERRAYKPARTQSEALYLLLGMANAGKLDIAVVRTLAGTLGANLAASASPDDAAEARAIA